MYIWILSFYIVYIAAQIASGASVDLSIFTANYLLKRKHDSLHHTKED